MEFLSETAVQTELLSSLHKFVQIRSHKWPLIIIGAPIKVAYWLGKSESRILNIKLVQIRSQSKVSSENQVCSFYWSHPWLFFDPYSQVMWYGAHVTSAENKGSKIKKCVFSRNLKGLRKSKRNLFRTDVCFAPNCRVHRISKWNKKLSWCWQRARRV